MYPVIIKNILVGDFALFPQLGIENCNRKNKVDITDLLVSYK